MFYGETSHDDIRGQFEDQEAGKSLEGPTFAGLNSGRYDRSRGVALVPQWDAKDGELSGLGLEVFGASESGKKRLEQFRRGRKP